jgi:hypothetical protein
MLNIILNGFRNQSLSMLEGWGWSKGRGLVKRKGLPVFYFDTKEGSTNIILLYQLEQISYECEKSWHGHGTASRKSS